VIRAPSYRCKIRAPPVSAVIRADPLKGTVEPHVGDAHVGESESIGMLGMVDDVWGGRAPKLVNVAVHSLSAQQLAGAGGQNWSTYGFIVSRLRNKFSAWCQGFLYHLNFHTFNNHHPDNIDKLKGSCGMGAWVGSRNGWWVGGWVCKS
jgi:hypothetical protein